MKEINDFKWSGDLDELIDFSMNCSGGYIRPMQVKEEIRGLLELVRERKVKRMVEIGTANGGTLFLFCKVIERDAFILTMDLPFGIPGSSYQKHKVPLYQSFAGPGQELRLFRGDSHQPETAEKIRENLGGQELDFLFIDGDHSYEGVKKDFEMYSQFVRKGGMIGFHDIAVHPPEKQCEVHRFWEEIKGSYEHKEFIKDKNQGGYGIGVLFK